MKKTIRFLFALLLTLAGVFIVSCQKDGGEDEGINGGSDVSAPHIVPHLSAKGDKYTITVDGTTISSKSVGYSFEVRARAITLNDFTCNLLRDNDEFRFMNECNLTLRGGSTFTLYHGGSFAGGHITLSGDGSITFIRDYINESDYNKTFSAAEGYTLTYSGKKDAGNGMQSCTWTIKKNQ